MIGRVKRAILTGGMLICFIGIVYSYTVNFDIGVYLNAGIMMILLFRWLSLHKQQN